MAKGTSERAETTGGVATAPPEPAADEAQPGLSARPAAKPKKASHTAEGGPSHMVAVDDPEIRELALELAMAARDNKALDIIVLDLVGRSSFADYMVLASGRSDRQVQAIAENMEGEVRTKLGIKSKGVEGMSGGQWVLLDYGLVVAHVFYEPMRGFYDLEGLYEGCKRLPVEGVEPVY